MRRLRFTFFKRDGNWVANTFLICIARSVGLAALALGAVPALAQFDDFRIRDDSQWTRFDPTGDAEFTFSNGGYRITSAPENQIARASAVREDTSYTDFRVEVDIVAWDDSLDQSFGPLARIGQLGINSTVGYAFVYVPARIHPGFESIIIVRLDGEAPSLLHFVPVDIDVGRSYRLVFEGSGSDFTGSIFDLDDLVNPLATAIASDNTYPGGHSGLISAANLLSVSNSNADATFDNFAACAPGIDTDGDGTFDGCDRCAGFDDAIDTDADGTPDACDVCPGFNDNNDADGDTVPDGCEFCLGDDVTGDSDADGVCDNLDVCPGFDDKLDADADTVPDDCDVCPGFDDFVDTDGDMVADGCDPCPLDNPDDTDGDGVCETDDVCPGFDDNVDTDGDTVPDGCDQCPGFDDNGPDDDMDGVVNACDRCPGTDDRLDSDGDGVPDGCDICMGDDAVGDSDGDGVCDDVDVCPGFDDAIDADGDTVPDGCDPCPLDNPNDTDGDGICDTDDRCPGFDDAIDTDGDGRPDGCDSNPLGVPGDTLAEAISTGLIGLGIIETSPGAIGDGPYGDKDVDIFSFEVTPETPLPAMLSAELRSGGSGLNSMLRLFNADGVELANNDDGSPTLRDPIVNALLVEPGIYYVGVSASENPHYDVTLGGSGRAGDFGTYETLALNLGHHIEFPDLFEPNDTLITAELMGTESFSVVDAFVGDGANAGKDVDIYRLSLTGPARLGVQVHVQSIGTLLDPFVWVRNCDRPIDARTRVDDCLLATGESSLDSIGDVEVSAGVLVAQDVYILVSGSGNRRYDPTTAGSGKLGSLGFYDLEVTVDYFEAGGIREPDDSALMATRLSPFALDRANVQEIDGFLGDGWYAPFRGDRDYYEVTLLDEPQLLTVEVETRDLGSSLDPVIVIYDRLGNVMASAEKARFADKPRITIPVACTLPGPDQFGNDALSVFVEVTATRQRPTLDPFLPVLFASQGSPTSNDPLAVDQHNIEDGPGSTGAYRLRVSVEPITRSCVNEPDNTLATATDTGLVDQGTFACVEGRLDDSFCDDPTDDVDLWSVTVAHPPALLQVSASLCRLDAASRLQVSVFDSVGNLIARREVDRPTDAPVNLRLGLDRAGTYTVAVVADHMHDFDPRHPCPSTLGGGSYDLAIVLSPGELRAQAATGDDGDPQPDPSTSLFATRLDAASNLIDVLDPDTGDILNTLPAPEVRFGGGEGLAYDGSHLYYVGTGRYPTLYQLDAGTGAVVSSFPLWFGSGFYGDAVMLGDSLCLLDIHSQSIHMMNPHLGRFIRSLSVGRLNQVTIGGGLATLSNPDRLFVADAFASRGIFEVSPATGQINRTFNSHSLRPTALAGFGNGRLLVGDWRKSTLETLDSDGNVAGPQLSSFPVGSLASRVPPTPLPDLDADGDLDLLDLSLLLRCYTGSTSPAPVACPSGDINHDERIDLADIPTIVYALTGPR